MKTATYVLTLLFIAGTCLANTSPAAEAWHCSNLAKKESFWIEDTIRPRAFTWDEYAREVNISDVSAEDDDRRIFSNPKWTLTIFTVAAPSAECSGKAVAQLVRFLPRSTKTTLCCALEALNR